MGSISRRCHRRNRDGVGANDFMGPGPFPCWPPALTGIIINRMDTFVLDEILGAPVSQLGTAQRNGKNCLDNEMTMSII